MRRQPLLRSSRDNRVARPDVAIKRSVGEVDFVGQAGHHRRVQKGGFQCDGFGIDKADAHQAMNLRPR